MAPQEIVGSYAGAMGISQFMPSNALTLAVDGNRDGRINLFENEDAIASVANYLSHHGYRPGLNREGKIQGHPALQPKQLLRKHYPENRGAVKERVMDFNTIIIIISICIPFVLLTPLGHLRCSAERLRGHRKKIGLDTHRRGSFCWIHRLSDFRNEKGGKAETCLKSRPKWNVLELAQKNI